jgi:hypothetical protein
MTIDADALWFLRGRQCCGTSYFERCQQAVNFYLLQFGGGQLLLATPFAQYCFEGGLFISFIRI